MFAKGAVILSSEMLNKYPTNESHRAQRIGCVAAVALCAFLIFWTLLPNGIVVMNDDFGYLRSVLLTASKHRPWTDDWLEPWAVSLSVISASVFKITGSFRLAIHGVQCLAFVGLCLTALHLLRQRQHSIGTAPLLTFVLCLCPTILWKSLEFTALVIYVPCLVMAIGAANRNRWGIFAVCACIALSSRQSALAWFAIPAIAVLQSLRTPPGEWFARSRGPMLACLAGGATWCACEFGMNQTHARQVMTAAMWGSFQPRSMIGWLAFALLLGLVCIGAANGLRWLDRNSEHRRDGRSGFRPTWYGLIVTALIVILISLEVHAKVQFEHDLYRSNAGGFYVGSWIAIAVAGWLVRPFRLDLRCVGGALASALLVSLRPATWDYYWIDTALLAFFAVSDAAPGATTIESNHLVLRRRSLIHRLAAFVVLAAMLLPSARWLGRVKAISDDCRAKEVLLEHSLRAGEILPSQLSEAPFGFKGWHLFPYFIKTSEGTTAYIAKFQDYLSEGSLTWETRGADNPNPISEPETIVRAEIFPIGWSGTKHQFILRHQASETPAPVKIDYTHYSFEAFPLNDAEWREWKYHPATR